MSTPFRIGAIPSLNALPLTAALRDAPPAEVTVTWGAPSELAASLHRGDLDLALIPQVEVIDSPDYRCIPDLAIACEGKVDSILLFTEKPWEAVLTVAVDTASRTSVELVRVLFQIEFGRVPAIVPADANWTARTFDPAIADALLVIGDRALGERYSSVPRVDLGAHWYARTALPFVFALWVGREGLDGEAINRVRAAAEEGLKSRAEIARAFADENPAVMQAEEAERYLTETLHYTLGAREFASIDEFATQRRAIGSPVPPGWTLPLFSEGKSGERP